MITTRTCDLTDADDEWRVRAVNEVLTVYLVPENEDTTRGGSATSAASSVSFDEVIDLPTRIVDVLLGAQMEWVVEPSETGERLDLAHSWFLLHIGALQTGSCKDSAQLYQTGKMRNPAHARA